MENMEVNIGDILYRIDRFNDKIKLKKIKIIGINDGKYTGYFMESCPYTIYTDLKNFYKTPEEAIDKVRQELIIEHKKQMDQLKELLK